MRKTEYKLPGLLARHAPQVQRFRINPLKTHYLYGRRLFKLTIPAGTIEIPKGYRSGDTIEITLVEITTAMDRLTCGIPLVSRGSLLESAGMFRIQGSYNGEKVRIKKGKKITVESLRDLRPGQKFGVYYRENGDWKQYPGGGLSSRMETIPSPAARPVYETDGDAKMAVPRRYMSIFKFGWWNFDRPDDTFILLRGIVIGGEGNTSVIAVSFGRSGQNGIILEKGKSEYSLRVLPGVEVYICAISGEGLAGSIRIVSKQVPGGSRSGEQQVPTIPLKEVPVQIRTNREAFRGFLKLPKEF